MKLRLTLILLSLFSIMALFSCSETPDSPENEEIDLTNSAWLAGTHWLADASRDGSGNEAIYDLTFGTDDTFVLNIEKNGATTAKTGTIKYAYPKITLLVNSNPYLELELHKDSPNFLYFGSLVFENQNPLFNE